MIENSLVENARLIRLEFTNLLKELNIYEKDFKKLAASFTETAEELKIISETVEKKDTLKTIQDRAMAKLHPLEIETNSITTKMSVINEKLERLRKEESDLYNIIKKRYPSYSDEDMKREIESRIL